MKKDNRRDGILYFRLSKRDADNLRNVAKIEVRTISSMVAYIVTMYLEKRQQPIKQDNPA